MADREKVISNFEHEVNKAHGEGWDFVDLTIEDAKEILALLKEQEPVQVIQREAMHMLFWCCGSCGAAITDGDKFCRICGNAVKWK